MVPMWSETFSLYFLCSFGSLKISYIETSSKYAYNNIPSFPLYLLTVSGGFFVAVAIPDMRLSLFSTC